MTARTLVRRAGAAAAALVALLVLPLASASSALAANGLDDGEEPGPSLSLLNTLLLFVGIPVLVFAVIWVLVTASARSRGPRYRPGLDWWAAPVWFNGPDDVDNAVRSAAETTGGGGASARW